MDEKQRAEAWGAWSRVMDRVKKHGIERVSAYTTWDPMRVYIHCECGEEFELGIGVNDDPDPDDYTLHIAHVAHEAELAPVTSAVASQLRVSIPCPATSEVTPRYPAKGCTGSLGHTGAHHFGRRLT